MLNGGIGWAYNSYTAQFAMAFPKDSNRLGWGQFMNFPYGLVWLWFIANLWCYVSYKNNSFKNVIKILRQGNFAVFVATTNPQTFYLHCCTQWRCISRETWKVYHKMSWIDKSTEIFRLKHFVPYYVNNIWYPLSPSCCCISSPLGQVSCVLKSAWSIAVPIFGKISVIWTVKSSTESMVIWSLP